MANGDVLSVAKGKGLAQQSVAYKLLDAAVAVGDGPWVDARACSPGSVEVFGTFVGTVQLRVSNQDTQPLASYEGSQIGANITAPGIVAIGMPVRWIKAIVPTGLYTSGSISAFFHSTT